MLILAYLSMFIDHIGAVFFPDLFIFRIIGRLALPIFAMRICDGYRYTKNLNSYLFRIFVIAVISQPLFYITLGYETMFETLNICFTLLLGLISIHILEKLREMKIHLLFFYLILTLMIISFFLIPVSYSAYGLLMILIVYYFRKDFTKFFISFSAVSFALLPILGNIIQIIPLFIFPILFSLDDKKFLYVDMKVLGFKYAHYLFYPLHLLVILLVKILFL